MVSLTLYAFAISREYKKEKKIEEEHKLEIEKLVRQVEGLRSEQSVKDTGKVV